MKYFLKYSYYIVVGLVFACIISALVGEMKWELIPLLIVNVFLVRLLDDFFDYHKDKKAKTKKQMLSLRQLVWATVILSLVYVTLSVVFYGLWGLFSLLILLYMGVQNKHETLKIFFVSVASIYYIGAYRGIDSMPIIIYLVIMVILSVGFYIYKRQKRLKKKGGQK